MSDQQRSSRDADEQANLDLSGDDAVYLRWARDIGFNLDIQTPNDGSQNGDEYVPTVRQQIDNWFDEFYVPVIDALWDEYVPKSGSCTVLQGELARCVGRLEGEYFKNGMMNMGDGHFDRMVDKIKDTVLGGVQWSPLVQSILETDSMVVKGADYGKIVSSFFLQGTDVEESLNRMKMVVAAWCVANPQPIELVPDQND